MTGPAHIPHDPDTAIRRTLLWWFSAPASAYVSLNFAVDFTAARAYLAGLAGEPRVTVQHLLAAAIARTLARHPLANAHVVRDRIVLRDRVGVAMPVNLLGHPGGKVRELGLTVVEEAERKSLRQVAAAATRVVREEREGRNTNGLVGFFTKVADRVPRRVFFKALDGFEALRRAPGGADVVYKAAPATTLLSNAGAPFAREPGLLFRGGAISPPHRLAHVGTVWGTATVQDEVVAVDGVPTVRPMLPVLLVFDHRLVDGVAAGRVAVDFNRVLQDPTAAFGEDGRDPPG